MILAKARSIPCGDGAPRAAAITIVRLLWRSETYAPSAEAFKASVLAKTKLGRLGRVEDLMGAVLYLASEASAMVTGASLLIDGGWTAE